MRSYIAAAHPLTEVEREIADLLASRAISAHQYGPTFAALWETAADSVFGGKLLRPRLLLGAFDALGGPDALRKSAVRLAAGVELLHYAFLLHDDIIDGDLQRRGRPNVIGALLTERADTNGDRVSDLDRHWATSSAILLGDLMLTLAQRTFAREPLADPTRLRLLDLLDHAITETVAGEHLDIALADRVVAPTLDTVMQMTRLKTATYTFELPLRVAGVLAGVDEETEAQLGTIGDHLGVAFQLQDDLLSTFGCHHEHGKDPYSDLHEGKETAIVAFARQSPLWPDLEPLFRAPQLSEAQVTELSALLAASGAERQVRQLVDDSVAACQRLMADAALPAALAEFIATITASLEERRS